MVHVIVSRDWEGRAPCAYGAYVKKMAYYKTTYGAQDAPEPHNGVSDVEYLERFPYNAIH